MSGTDDDVTAVEGVYAVGYEGGEGSRDSEVAALVAERDRMAAELALAHAKISDDRQRRWSMQKHLDVAAARLAEYEKAIRGGS